MMSPKPETGIPRASWFWLLGPPAAVVACLLAVGNVFAVFVAYHLGLCLVLPAANNLLRRGFSWTDHLTFLGLTGAGTARMVYLGLGLGGILAVAIFLAFRLLGDWFLSGHDVPGILARWGAGPDNLTVLFWFMVLAGGPAEELYWRGFVHGEMADRRPRLPTILLIAACFASYHGVTLYLLVPAPAIAVLFMAFIFAAGWGWGWLREKTGSVWPALLGHAGAAIGYMTVARPLLDL